MTKRNTFEIYGITSVWAIQKRPPSFQRQRRNCPAALDRENADYHSFHVPVLRVVILYCCFTCKKTTHLVQLIFRAHDLKNLSSTCHAGCKSFFVCRL